MHKITIVSPVYNVEKYISNFINSVINQTYKDFELILVDDGSTDESINIAEKILKNSDLDYRIIKKENKGQSSARNAGLKVATGDWIVIPDSDDTLQKDYLEVMYNKTLLSNIDLIICDINNVTDKTIFNETKRTYEYEIKGGIDFFEDFFMHRISIGPYSLMIKNILLKNNNIEFNEKSKYSEEYTFICNVLCLAQNVIHVKEKLYNYCLRDASVSTGANIEKVLNGYNEIIKHSKEYLDMGNSKAMLYKKYAMPRWILATARFKASSLNYSDYKELMLKLKAKENIIKLISFPDKKTKLAAILFCTSMKIFYKIAKSK